MKKGFNEIEGPFVKRLDIALQEIGMQRQQYFWACIYWKSCSQSTKGIVHIHLDIIGIWIIQ